MFHGRCVRRIWLWLGSALGRHRGITSEFFRLTGSRSPRIQAEQFQFGSDWDSCQSAGQLLNMKAGRKAAY